jgi:catalase (peroxidase I)
MTRAEELERRILLKRQLMTLTDKEIQVLEDMLRKEKANERESGNGAHTSRCAG